jgi:ABC-type transporter Mla subunit MlaD
LKTGNKALRSAILYANLNFIFTEGSAVPSRKEIQWSQLRVGALVMAAMAVLVVLIFLMSGSTGGLFARKLKLRSYFENAAGLKDGAPVTLEGVTVGNVIHIRVIPDRNPTPVEVTMQVGHEYQNFLHTDSTASISQAGVLGDSYVDISSTQDRGPRRYAQLQERHDRRTHQRPRIGPEDYPDCYRPRNRDLGHL